MKEMKEVAEIVPVNYIIWIILVIFALIILLFKLLPSITKLFNSTRTLINDYEDLKSLVKSNSVSIGTLYDSMNSCKEKIEKIEGMTEKQQVFIDESLEERELIVTTLLSVVQGLQEVGANGNTVKSEREIQEYLIRKAHKKGA